MASVVWRLLEGGDKCPFEYGRVEVEAEAGRYIRLLAG